MDALCRWGRMNASPPDGCVGLDRCNSVDPQLIGCSSGSR